MVSSYLPKRVDPVDWRTPVVVLEMQTVQGLGHRRAFDEDLKECAMGCELYICPSVVSLVRSSVRSM